MEHSKLVGTVSNCAVSTYHGIYAVRFSTAPTEGESVRLFLEFTIFLESTIIPVGATLVVALLSVDFPKSTCCVEI